MRCKDCKWFETDENFIPSNYGRCLSMNTDMPEEKPKELIYAYTSDPFICVMVIVHESFGCVGFKKNAQKPEIEEIQ